MISRAFCVLVMAGLLSSPAMSADGKPPAAKPISAIAPAEPPPVAAPPGKDDILILPLNVHVLTDPNRPDLNCKLSDDDLTRIMRKVNRVWRQAGLQFHVQPVLREPPHEPEAFDRAQAKIRQGMLGAYRMIANPKTRDLPGVHVYYLHELPPNGVYIGGNLCFVKETASLRKVEGGIDEPIPRVTSHEIGHALGLRHRQDRTNLMASGTTGATFSEPEVKLARRTAQKNTGVMTVKEAQARVKGADGNDPAITSLRELLRSIDSEPQ